MFYKWFYSTWHVLALCNKHAIYCTSKSCWWNWGHCLLNAIFRSSSLRGLLLYTISFICRTSKTRTCSDFVNGAATIPCLLLRHQKHLTESLPGDISHSHAEIHRHKYSSSRTCVQKIVSVYECKLLLPEKIYPINLVTLITHHTPTLTFKRLTSTIVDVPHR